jgi:hypothetical protein
MQKSAIPHIDFWGADKTLADIGRPWLETTHKQEVNHDVEISADRLAADSQARRKLRRVQHLALIVSEHLPKTVKRLGWNAWT